MSIVAGGVGVVLIAKDIWELRSGVLPIISDEMKSDATKQRVKEELAESIAGSSRSRCADISVSTADPRCRDLAGIPPRPRQGSRTCGADPPFRAFLDAAGPEQLPRIDELVGIIVADEGDAGVLKRLENGTLYDAVNRHNRAGHDNRARSPVS